MLAHEFAHIKNRDILVSSIAAMIASAISAIANILQFGMIFGGGSDNRDNPLGGLAALATIIIAPIAAMVLQLAVSRQREYLADATGAALIGDAKPLADALETLERGVAAIPMPVTPATATMYIANPLRHVGMAGLFQTHPPMDERIRRLRALRTSPIAPSGRPGTTRRLASAEHVRRPAPSARTLQPATLAGSASVEPPLRSHACRPVCSCGRENPDESRFCNSCGAALEVDVALRAPRSARSSPSCSPTSRGRRRSASGSTPSS